MPITAATRPKRMIKAELAAAATPRRRPATPGRSTVNTAGSRMIALKKDTKIPVPEISPSWDRPA